MANSYLGNPMCGQSPSGYEFAQARRCVEGMSYVTLVVLLLSAVNFRLWTGVGISNTDWYRGVQLKVKSN